MAIRNMELGTLLDGASIARKVLLIALEHADVNVSSIDSFFPSDDLRL